MPGREEAGVTGDLVRSGVGVVGDDDDTVGGHRLGVGDAESPDLSGIEPENCKFRNKRFLTDEEEFDPKPLESP